MEIVIETSEFKVIQKEGFLDVMVKCRDPFGNYYFSSAKSILNEDAIGCLLRQLVEENGDHDHAVT